MELGLQALPRPRQTLPLGLVGRRGLQGHERLQMGHVKGLICRHPDVGLDPGALPVGAGHGVDGAAEGQ